jgi:hypothetical protein
MQEDFFLVFFGWGETESTWYFSHCWPIVPAPDDHSCLWSSWWNEDWQGKPKYSEKTCPSATLSATNPTWPDLGSNPGRRGGKPATNRLSYGTAIMQEDAEILCYFHFAFALCDTDKYSVCRIASREWFQPSWEREFKILTARVRRLFFFILFLNKISQLSVSDAFQV